MATIACKLPNGLTVTYKDITITLAGSRDPGAVAGFGMTPDVDEDWFKSWAAEAKDFPPLKNGSIFAATTLSDASDAAKERTDDEDVQTGLEPLDADAPAPGIEPTEETKKELAKTAGKTAEAKSRARRG